jgi:hypothetical protein
LYAGIADNLPEGFLQAAAVHGEGCR